MKLKKEVKEVIHPSKMSRYKVMEFDEYARHFASLDGEIVSQMDVMIYRNKVEAIVFTIIPN